MDVPKGDADGPASDVAVTGWEVERRVSDAESSFLHPLIGRVFFEAFCFVLSDLYFNFGLSE